MGDDDEGNVDLLKRVVRDPEGNRRVDRVLDAVRGRRSPDSDLVPRLAVGLVAALVLAPVVGYLDYGTVAGAVEALGWGLVAYLSVAALWVTDRIEDYYEDDEEIAVEELRARYARGEMDLETFQERVERVYEEGPAWVFQDDEEDGDEVPPGGSHDESGGDDPMAILQRRFARGELSEAEYRRRAAALEETTGGASSTDGGDEMSVGQSTERDPSTADRETEST